MRIIASVAALVLSAGTAQAACSTAALAGKWSLFADGLICPITVQADGDYSGSCKTFGAPTSDPVSGELALRSSCKLAGTFNYEATEFKLRARADADVNLMVGQIVNEVAFTAMRN